MAILDYLIPGYKGYRLRAESRETDKLFRMYVSNLLAQDQQALEDIKVQLTHTGNLAALNPADQCSKALMKVRDRLRFANYGFSALFEGGQKKVDHERLERVEQFDKYLVDQRDLVTRQIQEIQNLLDSGENPVPAFRKLLTLIKKLDQHMETREQLIRGQVDLPPPPPAAC